MRYPFEMSATVRRGRAAPRDFGVKLDPRVTRPPDVLSQTPVTNDVGGPSVFSPVSSWNSSSGGASHTHGSSGKNTPSTHIGAMGPSSSASRRSAALVSLGRSTGSPSESLWPVGSPFTMPQSPMLGCGGAPSRLSASRIVPNLYLGGERDTFDPDLLWENNIQCILNLAEECHPYRGLAEQCTFVGAHEPIIDDSIPFWYSAGEDTPPQAMQSPDLTDGDFEMLGSRTCTFPATTPTITPQGRDDASTTTPATTSSGSKRFLYKYVPLKDSVDTEIEPYFAECADFIRSALVESKGVLVHCRVGVSRSAAMVIAYLMMYGLNLKKPCKTSFEIAHERVAHARPMINPNLAFGYALRSLDQSHEFRSEIWEPATVASQSAQHAIKTREQKQTSPKVLATEC